MRAACRYGKRHFELRIWHVMRFRYLTLFPFIFSGQAPYLSVSLQHAATQRKSTKCDQVQATIWPSRFREIDMYENIDSVKSSQFYRTNK